MSILIHVLNALCLLRSPMLFVGGCAISPEGFFWTLFWIASRPSAGKNWPLGFSLVLFCFVCHFFICFLCFFHFPSGPGCSKLTTSLVNVSFKFQTCISNMPVVFVEKKMRSFSHLFNKNFSIFGYKVVKDLMSWPLNELVQLTMLWTTWPWCLRQKVPNGCVGSDRCLFIHTVVNHNTRHFYP